MLTREFLEALADRLTVDDLCTYLEIESEDIIERFTPEVERRYSELAELIGWMNTSFGD
jgi:MoxR-like ATPase